MDIEKYHFESESDLLKRRSKPKNYIIAELDIIPKFVNPKPSIYKWIDFTWQLLNTNELTINQWESKRSEYYSNIKWFWIKLVFVKVDELGAYLFTKWN